MLEKLRDLFDARRRAKLRAERDRTVAEFESQAELRDEDADGQVDELGHLRELGDFNEIIRAGPLTGN